MCVHHSLYDTAETVGSAEIFGAVRYNLRRCSNFVYFIRFGNEMQVNDKAIFSVFYAQTFFVCVLK